jgi:hypothetical protein
MAMIRSKKRIVTDPTLEEVLRATFDLQMYLRPPTGACGGGNELTKESLAREDAWQKINRIRLFLQLQYHERRMLENEY